jgi:hypothetical protein
MSNREVQGGSVYSTGSNIYELEVERPNIKRLKNGPIANYTSVLASAYRQQAKDPF